MTQIWEYIKIALMNIRTNKGRSFLTMLGIIIGISSVILIITVGNGVKNGVNSGLDDMVGNQIVIYSNEQNDQGEDIELTMEDFDRIKREIDNVSAVYNSWSTNSVVENKRGCYEADVVLGTPDMSYDYRKQPIKKGREISDNDYYAKAPVCVINEKSAKALFGNTDVIGMTIELTLYKRPCMVSVIGVREDESLNGVFAYIASLMDEGPTRLHIEMPETYILGMLGIEEPSTNFFTVVSSTAESQNQVAKDVLHYVEKKYDCIGKNLIRVEKFGDYMNQMNQMLDYITLFVGLVAAISLVVGGIGVMNIMLVSVTERTREIGIRKALGARTSSIMLQFLSESAIITLLGGVIGIAIGIGGAYAICGIIGFPAKVNITSVIGASAFSAAVGIFFGLYPAKKAAKLSPIEALRHE